MAPNNIHFVFGLNEYNICYIYAVRFASEINLPGSLILPIYNGLFIIFALLNNFNYIISL